MVRMEGLDPDQADGFQMKSNDFQSVQSIHSLHTLQRRDNSILYLGLEQVDRDSGMIGHRTVWRVRNV
jgi:hypothetical protein